MFKTLVLSQWLQRRIEPKVSSGCYECSEWVKSGFKSYLISVSVNVCPFDPNSDSIILLVIPYEWPKVLLPIDCFYGLEPLEPLVS